jgi:phosphoenolpyruvate carboxykinase (ATP)
MILFILCSLLITCCCKIPYSDDVKSLRNLIVDNYGEITKMNNTLNILTGKFTGRSPKDRYIVYDDETEDKVDWNENNQAITKTNFYKIQKSMKEFLENKKTFTRKFYGGTYHFEIVTTQPQYSLFVYNMFIEPSIYESLGFVTDWKILHAPEYKEVENSRGTRSKNFVILCFTEKTILIGGTGYTGEIKKSVFTVLNFLYPTYHDVFPMHCSANKEKNTNNTALFFGLSGTGKTTLSADKDRLLIGDDKHGWTDNNEIFNMEGGSYAKVIDLTYMKEPDIWNSIHSSAMLENVVIDKKTGMPKFSDSSITDNMRVSYPLHHITQLKSLTMYTGPQNVFFLSCDAYGILPPVSKLTYEDAGYHFLSGYTAKVAGTEQGINEPQATFSACFGLPFMILKPNVYSTLLQDKLQRSNANVWLLNTGWVGGSYGVGKRISLEYTRRIVSLILSNRIDSFVYERDDNFKLNKVIEMNEIEGNVLNQELAWKNLTLYKETYVNLNELFHKNIKYL